MKYRYILIGLLSLVSTFSLIGDNWLYGAWEWNSESDPRDIKVLFKDNGNVIYKISNLDPIIANWELSDSLLTITSENFVWDYEYAQIFPGLFHRIEKVEKLPFNKGKILPIKGDIEKYRIKSSGDLEPINSICGGVLTKIKMEESEFKAYTPRRVPHGYLLDSEMNIPHKSSVIATKKDSLFRECLDMVNKIHSRHEQYKTQQLLDKMPEKIDSIEIKLIGYSPYGHEYFAIDRRAFDKTFDYLIATSNNKYALVDCIIDDANLISYIVNLLQNMQPYPSEAIKNTPYNVWRSCKGFSDDDYGIITDEKKSIDPIETQGKITIFSEEEIIVCFLSPLSIDYKNHRYILSSELAYILWFLNLYMLPV